MPEIHVGIFHALHENVKAYLQNVLSNLQDLKVKYFPRITPEMEMTAEMEHTIRNAEVLVGFFIPVSWLAKADRLKLLISPFAGVKPLITGIKELRPTHPHFSDVALTNSHGNARFVAVHTIGLLLSLMNKIIFHHKRMEAGVWSFKQETEETIPLFGKTVGFLGYGKINQHLHRYMSGFPCNFAALRHSWKKLPHEYPTVIRKFTEDQLHDFLGNIDILIIAIPLTPMTKNLIGKAELKVLGKDGIVVNMARGPIVDEAALYEALKTKTINGACVDVWWEYSPQPDSTGKFFPTHYPFHELPNFVMSPHRADSPFADLTRWDDILANIQKFVSGDSKYLNIVDLDLGY